MTASEYEQVRKAPRVHVPVWQSFALSEVELTDSYFKKAMALHKGYLLSLDVDRLIPHVRRSVGLQGKGDNYGGWEKHGGCTYGHYMSACAMMYASTGEKALLDKLNYMLDELQECQKQTPDGWFITGKGLAVSFVIGSLSSIISQYVQYGNVNWIQAGIDGLFAVASRECGA